MVAASRLIGYQILPAFSTPYVHASTAMATLPANPPFTPAETGYVCTGSHARGRSGATATRSTRPRSVVTCASSGTTTNTSSRGCGKTSRNQPAHPATASTAPSADTETLVSSPANMKVHPAASTSGHAVGAGTSI